VGDTPDDKQVGCAGLNEFGGIVADGFVLEKVAAGGDLLSQFLYMQLLESEFCL